MIFKCPGSQKFSQPQPEFIKCAFCGKELEIWSDEVKTVCPHCKKTVTRAEAQSCLNWCKYAKECVGEEVYEKYKRRQAAKYVDLILFDLDGTLVDSRKDITNAINFTLRKMGLKEKGLQEISSYIGRGVRDLLLKSLGANQKELLEKALSIFTEYFRKHSTDESFLYPGVTEVLGYFGKKRKIIVTNRNHEFAVLTLKTLDIYDYFENILGGDDGACVKPSSCPLDKTIYSLNVDKDKSIMVGDMDIDVLAGKGAGIATCAVTYGIGRREEILKAKPDYIIGDILELKKIIR